MSAQLLDWDWLPQLGSPQAASGIPQHQQQYNLTTAAAAWRPDMAILPMSHPTAHCQRDQVYPPELYAPIPTWPLEAPIQNLAAKAAEFPMHPITHSSSPQPLPPPPYRSRENLYTYPLSTPVSALGLAPTTSLALPPYPPPPPLTSLPVVPPYYTIPPSLPPAPYVPYVIPPAIPPIAPPILAAPAALPYTYSSVPAYAIPPPPEIPSSAQVPLAAFAVSPPPISSLQGSTTLDRTPYADYNAYVGTAFPPSSQQQVTPSSQSDHLAAFSSSSDPHPSNQNNSSVYLPDTDFQVRNEPNDITNPMPPDTGADSDSPAPTSKIQDRSPREEDNSPIPTPPTSRPASSRSRPVSTHHIKRYTCPTCAKRFSRRSALGTHSFTHTGEKPFSCSCGRMFSVLSNLRRHGKSCRKKVNTE
ncbi:hypothetical protein DFS34DRAFT_607417 [Phlyctochytrium arcticum]|nr:hypothetical protein DFS34DRAFT_607417 [Phlyctochytrium arcticum]